MEVKRLNMYTYIEQFKKIKKKSTKKYALLIFTNVSQSNI